MFNLFVNIYQDKNATRQAELDFCLLQNLSNPLINTIVFNCQDRLSYSFFFDKINKISAKDDINIIANADIYFDETIQLASSITEHQCFALSRWDILVNGTPSFFHREDSQDVWIFKGKIKSNLFGNFTLGFCGCDNRLAYEMKKAGYQVINPSLSIKAYHKHSSQIRNYIMRDKRFIVPGPYMKVDPCWLGHPGKTKVC
ncbi:MAG: hypothetical protein WC679_13985 [Bacteroidales bacterium]|jgi:hypothetical protein